MLPTVGDMMILGGGSNMNESNGGRSSQHVAELTSEIRDMASQVRTEFVPDQQKTQNFIAACEQREKDRGSAR